MFVFTTVASHHQTSGNPFIVHHRAREKGARQAFPTSKFYRRFPSKTKDTTNGSVAGQKGYFENLCQYVALGFTIGDKDITRRLTNTVEGESMFNFSEEEVSKIHSLNREERVHGRQNARI